MGQQQSIVSHRQRGARRRLTLNSQILTNVSCPYCGVKFSQKTTYSVLNDHLYKCGNSQKGESTKTETAIAPPTTENDFQLVIDYNSNNYDNGLNLKKAKSETVKVDNGAFTEKQKLRLLFLNFDTKYSYFRSQLIKNDTAESSTITKLDDFLNINLYNEITYEDKRNEIPLTTIFNNYLDEMIKNGFLSLTKNKKINITETIQEFDAQLFGVIIVKSIINNYPLKYKIAPLLLKMLFDRGFTIEDIKDFEPNLYNSLKTLKEIKNIEKKTHLCYIIEKKDKDGNIVKDELLFGGERIKVTNNNIDDYIDKRIHYEMKKYNETLFLIKNKIFEFINQSMFSVFTLGELDKIVCNKV